MQVQIYFCTWSTFISQSQFWKDRKIQSGSWNVIFRHPFFLTTNIYSEKNRWYRITVESQSCWLLAGNSSVWSCWTVTQSGLSWLEACTFTITHSRGLLLGTRNRIEELDSIWNHLEPFGCTMTATEIKQHRRMMIQSKILTLSIVVYSDIKFIEINRHSGDVRFHM